MARQLWSTGALCAASTFILQPWSASRCLDTSQQPMGTAAAAVADAGAAATSKLNSLADWLRQQGADIDAIEIKPSPKVSFSEHIR